MFGSTASVRPAAIFLSSYARWCALLLLMFSAIEQARAAKNPLVVVSEVVSDDVVRQVPLTGTITSARVSSLSAHVDGKVSSLAVEVGDEVKAGAVLLALDSELERLALQASQAATAQARAELTDARRRFENGQQLRQQKSISMNELELLEAEVAIKQAALQRQQAEQRRQQVVVDYHQLKAPFDGVISQRYTDVGEWIEPGNPVLELVDMDRLRAEFRVPQEFFMQIDDRSRVSVTLDPLPGRSFDGNIDAVVPVSDPNARTFLVHVSFDHHGVRITPGMSVRARLNLATGTTGVVIPRDALLRYPDGRITVWLVSEPQGEATVSEHQVKIGNSFDGRVVITSGLQAGAFVVIRGNESLQEGQTVRIQQQ